MRVRRRYAPARLRPSDGWRKTIHGVEIARAADHYDTAHEWMITDDGLDWKKKIRKLPARAGLDPKDFDKGIQEERYKAQVAKDLYAMVEQYNVKKSPAIFINGVPFEGDLDSDELAKAVEVAILKASI